MDEFDPTVDGFETATTDYVTPMDLLDRLLLVIPLRQKSMKNNRGEEYTAVFCDIVVLSGKPSDKIPDVPTILEDVMLSAGRCVAQLTPRLPSARNGFKGRMLLGRLNGRPSQHNKQVLAFGFGEPDQDGDNQKGRVGMALYKASQEQVKGDDPFA